MSGTTMMTFSGGAHCPGKQAPAKVPQSRENELALGKAFRHLFGIGSQLSLQTSDQVTSNKDI